MQATIFPGKISGELQAPPSKSAMQRACALSLLHNGITNIYQPGVSNDDEAALGIISDLGAEVVLRSTEKITIKSTGNITGSSFYAGESGLSMRMFAALAALAKEPLHITGSGSLLIRPVHFFEEVFPQLSVQVKSNNGLLPVTLQGPLNAKNITVDGSLSSQFLTGMLLSYGATVKAPVTITVTNLKSKPYIDLTLAMQQQFGHNVINNNYTSFLVSPAADKSRQTINYTVEGDWSGAAFLMVAGAINGHLDITGLQLNSPQADRAILQALMQAGASLSLADDLVTVRKSVLSPFQFDATDCPDLFPPLVALAAYCNGTSVITGVSRLAHKESDRGSALQTEFGKLGVNIRLQDDLMIIEGGGNINGSQTFSHHDHRIAMALAVAALGAKSKVHISEAQAVNKSYPQFYEHLKMAGINVELQNN